MNDVSTAKRLLLAKNYTCVLCRGENVHVSTLRGVKPLVALYESGQDFTNYSAADKVVGKATAFLYLLLGVQALYAGVISKPALDLLLRHGVKVEYGTRTENVVNRTGDGICPFEQAVLSVSNSQEAYQAVRNTMKAMGITL